MLELATKINFHKAQGVRIKRSFVKLGLTVALQLTNTAIEYKENTNVKAISKLVSSLKQCSLYYIFSSTYLTVNNLLIPKTNLL